jgi:hypothetical protein
VSEEMIHDQHASLVGLPTGRPGDRPLRLSTRPIPIAVVDLGAWHRNPATMGPGQPTVDDDPLDMDNGRRGRRSGERPEDSRHPRSSPPTHRLSR